MTSLERLNETGYQASDPRQQMVDTLVRHDQSPADGAWIAQQFPELVDYSRTLQEELIPNSIKVTISREDERMAAKRGMRQAKEYVGGVTAVFGYLLSNFPDRVDEAIGTAAAHISSKLGTPPEMVEAFIQDQVTVAAPYVERTKQVNECVTETPQLINELLMDNPRSRYEVAQVLIAAGNAKGTEGQDTEMLQSFADIALGTVPDDIEAHIGFFPEELMEGLYDDFLLQDIVRGLDAIEKAGFNALAKTIRLTAKVAGPLGQEELARRLYANKDYWTVSMRNDFELVKTQMIKAFGDAFKRTKDRVEKSGYIPSSAYDSYEDAEQELQENTVLAMATLISTMGAKVPTGLQAEAIQLKSKRKRRLNVIGDEAPGLETEPTAVHERQLLGAIFTASGVVSGAESDLQQVVEEFTKGRATEQFNQDVDAVMAFLQKLDMSSGAVRGVKQFHAQVLVNGRKLPIYSLKPADANGLPTKTALMKNCRIFFTTPDDESVLVIAISDRKNVEVWQKRLAAAV